MGTLGLRSVTSQDGIGGCDKGVIGVSRVVVVAWKVYVKKIIRDKIGREKFMVVLVHKGGKLKLVDVTKFESRKRAEIRNDAWVLNL